MINIDDLFIKGASAFRRQRSRKTEIERGFIKGSKLLVGTQEVKLKLNVRIPSQISLYQQRQNGRCRCSDEADAKDPRFPARSPLRRPGCLIGPLQNANKGPVK